MTEIGFQLYSVRDVADSLPGILERVGETSFAGVEFAGLHDASVAEVREALDRSGLSTAGAHVGLEAIEDDPAAVAETYRALNCDDVAVGWISPDEFESVASVEAVGARLADAAAELGAHDLDLHYHNHDHEFVERDGELAIDRLFDAADGVGFEIDLGWVGAAGYDPLSVLREYDDRISLVHLKDYDAAAGETAVVGDGDLDIDATFAAVREQDVDWIVYEAEEGSDTYETLEQAAAVVDEHW